MKSDSKNRIGILHDSFGKPSPLRKEWGFAALIELNAKRFLFDTGNMFAGLGDSIALPP